MLLLLPAALWICLCSGARGSDELVVPPCDQPLFQAKLQLCLDNFSRSMESTEYRSRCVWPEVKRSYKALKQCVDEGAQELFCGGVGGAGSLGDDFFLDVHRTYFPECGRVRDPPLSVLMLMTVPLVVSTLTLPLLCVHLTTKVKPW